MTTGSTGWSASRLGGLVCDYVLVLVFAALSTLWSLALWVALVGRMWESGLDEWLAEVQVAMFVVWLAVWVVLRLRVKKRGRLTTRLRVTLALVAVAHAVYLVWDEDASPAVQRNRAVVGEPYTDEATYRLTLRFTKQKDAKAAVFVEPARRLSFDYKPQKQKPGVSAAAASIEARRGYLLAHREDILANWADMAELRAWWAEMSSQARIGDARFSRSDQPLISFRPVKTYMNHALAVACLRGISGDGDSALELVGEVYRVGARLEADSCTLVRSMVGRAVQRQAVEAGLFVVETSKVGWSARARLTKFLAEPAGGAEGVRRVVLSEATFWTSDAIRRMFAGEVDSSDGVFSVMIRPFVRFAVNPQMTINRLHEVYERMAELAMKRDLDGIEAENARFVADQLGGLSAKNLGGRMLLRMSLPAYKSVTKSYWETEELRDSLIEQLGGERRLRPHK